jgi:hypothetical protein
MNPMLIAALEYASRGWSVFPLLPNGKKPITSNGLYAATTDPEQIRAWWTQTPDANIGLPMGAINGLTAADEDVKDGAKGRETLRALLGKHSASLDNYAQTRTASGGRHFISAYDELARHGARRFGPGLDCVNDGGYLVAPPSAIGGKAYEWVVPPDALLPFPGWLRAEQNHGMGASTGIGGSFNEPGWADRLIEQGVDKGERDYQAWRLIGHARWTGKNEAECTEMITLFGSRCRPPFDPATDRNIAQKIRRAYSKPAPERGSVEMIPWPKGEQVNDEPDADAAADTDHGGERFSDHVNAVRAAEQARRALRHADELGEKWMHVGRRKWAIDFRGVVKPYAQKVAQVYYTASQGVRDNKTRKVRAEMNRRAAAERANSNGHNQHEEEE